MEIVKPHFADEHVLMWYIIIMPSKLMCGIQKTEKPNKTSAPPIIVNISVIAITIVNISLQLLFFKGSLIDCREWLSEKYFSVFPLCFFSQRPLTLNWENQLDCQTTEWSIVFSVFGHPLSTRWLYYGSEEIYFDPRETEGTCLWMESGRRALTSEDASDDREHGFEQGCCCWVTLHFA